MGTLRMTSAILAIVFVSLFSVISRPAPAVDLIITPTPLVSGATAATSTTLQVDLTTSLGLTPAQLANEIALGNVYARAFVVSDGTINGAVRFVSTNTSGITANGSTIATTGILVPEGGEVVFRITGRYLAFIGVGSDTDHTISVTLAEPPVRN
jgi:hypothetical protein